MPSRDIEGTSRLGEPAGALVAADHTVVRDLNRSLVLDVLRRHGPISRSGIASVAHLAKPTVSAIVEDLIAEGTVAELGPGSAQARVGRPAILLTLDPLARFYVGLHVGVNRTTILIGDATGAELHRTQRPTRAGNARQHLLALAARIETMIESQGLDRTRLAAVGVALPGMVDSRLGTCLLAPNLGWRDLSAGPILSQRLEAPVFVHNTAQVCALAEAVEGAADGAQDLVLLYAGTGIGAGVVSGGRLLRGAGGVAGEIGHCRATVGDLPCTCGKTGCLETVASGHWLVSEARRRRLIPETGGTTDVISLARHGNDQAAELLAGAGQLLGVAASWLINLFDPERLLLGGGLVDAGDLLIGPLQRSMTANALPQPMRVAEVVPWSLGHEAKGRGALIAAMRGAELSYRLTLAR